MKREDLEIIKDYRYINESGEYVLTKEQLYKLTDKIHSLSVELNKKKKEVRLLHWFQNAQFVNIKYPGK